MLKAERDHSSGCQHDRGPVLRPHDSSPALIKVCYSSVPHSGLFEPAVVEGQNFHFQSQRWSMLMVRMASDPDGQAMTDPTGVTLLYGFRIHDADECFPDICAFNRFQQERAVTC